MSKAEEQLEGMFGPAPKYSEHHAGETITFLDNGKECQGVILHVIKGTPIRPMLYVVDDDSGFPTHVQPGDIVEALEPLIDS